MSDSSVIKVAMKYLCAPLSSVESERTFKSAKGITGGNRNRLLPDNVRKLLFLKHNLSAIGFNSMLLDNAADDANNLSENEYCEDFDNSSESDSDDDDDPDD